MYGKKYSVNTKKKISASLINPSEETRKKIGLSHKIKIGQFLKDGTLVKEWDSINEVAAYFGVTRSNISHCINGVIKTYKGFIFKKI